MTEPTSAPPAALDLIAEARLAYDVALSAYNAALQAYNAAFRMYYQDEAARKDWMDAVRTSYEAQQAFYVAINRLGNADRSRVLSFG